MPDPRHADRDRRRFGVLDVGSNSIRLVVYEATGLLPVPVFNERTMCALGDGVEKTGRLADDRIEAALACLGRYFMVARELDAGELDVLATAAVRDAENGGEFVATVERRFGWPVRVLSGADEARLAALGVLGGFAHADGFVGDLGGGSLELIELSGGATGRWTTMPLGPLRLGEITGRTKRRILSKIDLHISAVPWLGALSGKTLYAVGGAWRTIARAHMEARDYPLEIIHGYAVETQEFKSFLDRLAGMSAKQARTLPGVSKRRADRVPITSLVLKRLLDLAQPDRVVFSAYGVREGSVFERRATAMQLRDPFLESCAAIAAEAGRAAIQPGVVARWVRPFLGDVTSIEDRLVQAACLLSDIAWAEHPSYRGEHAFLRVLRLPSAGTDHADRVFLALAILARYTGTTDLPEANRVRTLLTPEHAALAKRLGVALRLAHTLCGGAVEILRHIETSVVDGRGRLRVPRHIAPMLGEVVGRRVDSLAAEIARPIDVEILK